MTEPNNKRALLKSGSEAAIEIVKLIPGAGALIEGVRKYHEYIEDELRLQFVQLLEQRIARLEERSEWYKSSEGEQFLKKVIATALNAEYADKVEYLANAIVNGPSVEDQTQRLKLVEMIRQVSKPAIDVLVVALKHPTGTGQVMPKDIANRMRWHPALVDACVQELYALGAFSYVTTWRKQSAGYTEATSFSPGTPALTDITRAFAAFVAE